MRANEIQYKSVGHMKGAGTEGPGSGYIVWGMAMPLIHANTRLRRMRRTV